MSNKIDPNPKKYGYARVSSKSQEVNSSLESQKQELVRINPFMSQDPLA